MEKQEVEGHQQGKESPTLKSVILQNTRKTASLLILQHVEVRALSLTQHIRMDKDDAINALALVF